MSLILIYNDRTETVEFKAAFNEHCCIFDEICNVIIAIFNLNNLWHDYQIVYYDPSYGAWINFNIHVTKRITELIRYSTSKTLKLRIERRRKQINTLFLEKKTTDQVKSQKADDNKYAHLIIWLDEHIGNPFNHKQLKRNCRAMINTTTSLLMDDNIDTLIQYNNFKCNLNFMQQFGSKYFIETPHSSSCPFQCTLLTVDNTDKFFEYLNMTSELTRSLSIIVSENFIKDIVPIILSRKRKQLLPNVLFLYLLCSNISNYQNWALGYIENDNLPVKTHLELFDDKKALFVHLVSEIRHQLTLEANTRRDRKEYWHALQYYSAAKQLFLNSLIWESCYTRRELDNLNQLIEESEREANEFIIKTFCFDHIYDKYYDSNDKIGQQCTEI